MDLIKEISLEINNQEKLVRKYSSFSSATNYFSGLRESLQSKDMETIIYCLRGIDEWYTANIGSIKKNTHIGQSGQREHENVRLQVKGFLERAINYEYSEEGKRMYSQEKEYKIFISHSSKDKDICTPFVELLEELGIPEKNILYSSNPRLGIPGDEDIFNYLRNKIDEKYYMFYMLSDNYYESVICLNEMGAAWVSQNEFSIFLLPNLSKGIKGVVDSSKKGWDITNSVELNDLKNKLLDMFNLEISENKWDQKKNNYLAHIKK